MPVKTTPPIPDQAVATSERASEVAEIARSLLAEFERELTTTRRFIEHLPEERLSWQPHEKSMTAGQLALHIAQAPAGVLQLSQVDEATLPNFSADRQQPATLGEVFEELDRTVAYIRQNLPKVDDLRMSQTFRVVQSGRAIMAMPRVDFLRSIMLNHWYHHRGQFGVYLRLVGAKVPSSYGPSGDE
jgi:uncharacterized damage-inducible protein DinB